MARKSRNGITAFSALGSSAAQYMALFGESAENGALAASLVSGVMALALMRWHQRQLSLYGIAVAKPALWRWRRSLKAAMAAWRSRSLASTPESGW